jgi:hypothetical protein
VSDLEKIPQHLQKQYAGAYGPFVPGDYGIGDTISVPGQSGEVLWSFQSAEGLKYVVDDNTGGFPVEVKANEVYGSVEPWR